MSYFEKRQKPIIKKWASLENLGYFLFQLLVTLFEW